VGTFRPRPLSIVQVVALLSEHLGFEDVCTQRGVVAKRLEAGGRNGAGGLLIVGVDGMRRVPVLRDTQLVEFFSGAKHTRLPTVEVQLASIPAARGKPEATDRSVKGIIAFSGPPQGGAREAKDRIEELEDDKFKLLRATDRLERRLDEVNRRLESAQEEANRNLGIARRELTASQDRAVTELKGEVRRLDEADQATLHDLEVERQNIIRVEAQEHQHHEQHANTIAEMGRRIEAQFEDSTVELERQREVDSELQRQVTANLEEARAELQRHGEDLARLEDVKVDKAVWQKAEEEMDARMRQDFAEVWEGIAKTEAQLRLEIEEAQVPIRKAIARLEEEQQQQTARIDDEITRLTADLEAGLEAAKEALDEARTDLEQEIQEKVDSLHPRFDGIEERIIKNDAAITGRVDDLSEKTEQTFVEMNERQEELIRVERARLGTIERDLAESTTKIRSDFRAEIERVRSDYEQEAARLDMDLGDLHVKHDVSKQEINFFQTRLVEQKDWTQRQLTETATATRAVAVDSQEALSATTKMLHALRDDAVGFREKMAKYISLLQHSSDGHGDAITSLEAQRSRMRSELDALISDHQAYVGDMDGWADDVRVKVERLFRALEPPRMEWRIGRVAQKAKELLRPQCVKSPKFSLRGLREVTMEFYPDGHNNSPEGKAVLRLFLPPVAHVRYQCCVGRTNFGPTEYKTGGSLSRDICIEEWQDQIQDDGSVYVTMEVLRDLNCDDESLSREVRVESI